MHVFTQDEYDAEFLKGLTSPEELSGLFNKVVKLLPELLRRNAFTNQMSMEQARALYRELANTEESFFDKFVTEKPTHFEPKAPLHKKYVAYCEKLGTPSKTINRFGRFINENILWLKGKTNSTTTIEGISVAAWPDTLFNEEAFNLWKNSLERL